MIFFLTLLTFAVILGFVSSVLGKVRDIKQISLQALQADNDKEHLRALELDEKEKEIKSEAEKLKSNQETFEKEKQIFANEKKNLYDNYYAKSEEQRRTFETKVNERACELLPEYEKVLSAERTALKKFTQEIEFCLKDKTSTLLDGIEIGRLHNYFLQDKDYYLKDIQVIATVDKVNPPKKFKPYKTELHQCTCYDFTNNHVPACKHMQFLAYSLGILQLYRNKHQADFDKMILDAKKAKKDGKSNDKSKKSPSLSNKNKNISSELRGSEEDM